MRALRWLVVLVIFGLAACGGGGEEPGETGAGTRSPVTEDSRATTATVDGAGASLTATASNGVTYTLQIPVGALAAPTQIRMTPISSMGDAPLAAGLLAAVQFEPSGLVFMRPASLRITGARAPANGRHRVGFSSANDGTAFQLGLARVDGNDTVLSVAHFSDFGVVEATDAELAAIPLVPLESPGPFSVADSVAALVRMTTAEASAEQIAAVFARWYREHVKPALEQADGSNNVSAEGAAVSLYTAWAETRAIAAQMAGRDVAAISVALAAEDADAGPRLQRILGSLIERELARCSTQSSLQALAQASVWQGIAQSYGHAGLESGLDRATFLLRANNCVRPVLDPIRLPSPLTAGSDVSLDARAQIVFPGTPNPQAAPFAFSVSATGAAVRTPDGFSDEAGRYTTVLTPSATAVAVRVSACLVLPIVGTSDICVSQSVASQNGSLSKQGALVFSTHPTGLPVGPLDPLIFQGTQSAGDVTVSASSFRDTVALPAGGTLEGTASCLNGHLGRLVQELFVTFETPTTLSYAGRFSTSGSSGTIARVEIELSRLAPSTFVPQRLLVDASIRTDAAAMDPIDRSIVLEAGMYHLRIITSAFCNRSNSVPLNPGVSRTTTSRVDVSFQ